MDLPADWVALGTPAYDTSLDATPDVAAWLKALDLDGQYAFRAYEPLAGSRGPGARRSGRCASWNPSPLQEEGAVAALPGVTGEVSSDVLASGADWKAFGYRWDETIDWGDGSPSARTCVGYFVMVDNPVNVVFCYPAGTDRQAEIDALVSTFEVLGNPVFSLPPGATPTPSPTPYDKFASPSRCRCRPSTPPRDMEALLPDAIDGRPVTKESRTGVEAGKTGTDPLLKAFGKQPADYALATGTVMPTEDQARGNPWCLPAPRRPGRPAPGLPARADARRQGVRGHARGPRGDVRGVRGMARLDVRDR